MFIKDTFTYDGVSSEEFNLYMVKNDNNYIQIPFGINRSIVKDKAKNNSKPYFFGTEEEVLKFKIKIGFDGIWTSEMRSKIVQWLFQNEYKPLVSTDNPDVIYYCMPVGNANLYLTYLSQGYAEIEFECNSPYAYSNISVSTFDLSANTNNTITLLNSSNAVKYYSPEIQIEKVGAGDISLVNISNGGIEFKFTGLQNNETVYVNNSKKQIITSVAGTYRYDAFNKNWLKLVYGENVIQVTGKCILTVRCQYPVAF